MALTKVFPLLGAALVLTGCEHIASVRLSQDVAEVYATGPAPHVVVETFNGSIRVERGASDHVSVVVTKVGSGSDQAAAEEDLANIEVTMQQDQDTIRVTARRLEERNCGSSEASVQVTAPAEAQLELTTRNGALTSREVRGPHELRTDNGAILVTGAQGRVTAQTHNGAITVDARDAVVDARTANGKVEFSGSLASGDQRFETSNGAIEIRLPEDASFAIEASTSNGSVAADFDLATAEKKDTRTLKGSIGNDPATRVAARTSNGTIRIRRAQGNSRGTGGTARSACR